MRKVIGAVLLLLGLGALAGGGVFWKKQNDFLRTAVVADGTVRSLQPSRGNRGSTTYTPIFAFRLPDGREIEARGSSASNPPAYRVGERVRILYDPANPTTAQAEGATFEAIAPYIFGGVGLLLTLIGWGVMTRRRTPAAPAGVPSGQWQTQAPPGNAWPGTRQGPGPGAAWGRPAPSGPPSQSPGAPPGWQTTPSGWQQTPQSPPGSAWDTQHPGQSPRWPGPQMPQPGQRVRRPGGFGTLLLLLFGLGALGGAVMCLVAGVIALSEHREFDAAAQTALGEVTALEPSGTGGAVAPRFRVRLNDGRTIEAVSPIAAYPPAYQVGEKVLVRFTLTDPPRIRAEGSLADKLHWIFFGVAGGLLVFGLILLRWRRNVLRRPPSFA